VVGQLNPFIVQLLQLSVVSSTQAMRFIMHFVLDDGLALLGDAALIPLVMQFVLGRYVLQAHVDPVV